MEVIKEMFPLHHQNKNQDEIAIRDLEVRCILGLYPHERLQPQPLFLDVFMHLDVDPCVASHDLNASVDYAAIAEELKFILHHARFEMLETAAHSLCHFLLGFKPIDRLRAPLIGAGVCLRKPKALAGTAFPEIKLYRKSDDRLQALNQDQAIRCLHRNGDCVLFQVNLSSEDCFFHNLSENYLVSIFSWTPLIMLGEEGARQDKKIPTFHTLSHLRPKEVLAALTQSNPQKPSTLMVLIKGETNQLSFPLDTRLFVRAQKRQGTKDREHQLSLH